MVPLAGDGEAQTWLYAGTPEYPDLPGPCQSTKG